jgi:hypothetical protein
VIAPIRETDRSDQAVEPGTVRLDAADASGSVMFSSAVRTGTRL